MQTRRGKNHNQKGNTMSHKLHGKLVTAFRAAKQAALPYSETEDGGTCNFDSPAFRIPRLPDRVIQAAAEEAGVRTTDFHWGRGQRWYWLSGFFVGQANRRSRMSDAATKSLREAMAEIPGARVCEYCQVD